MSTKKVNKKTEKILKNFCETFVGENKVTRDSRLTPGHYWEGSNYLKVYTRVNWFLNQVVERHEKFKKIEK